MVFLNIRTMKESAKALAHWAHDAINQRRKYPPTDPYWVHTDRVAALVESHNGTAEMVAAAHLHDVLEDVVPVLEKQDRQAHLGWLRMRFGEFPSSVRKMVVELTHVFTEEAYPSLTREHRKLAEVQRLCEVSVEAKSIKLADLVDNCADLVHATPEFCKKFLAEKKLLVEALNEGNQELLAKARIAVRRQL